jgi:hypothetical protein
MIRLLSPNEEEDRLISNHIDEIWPPFVTTLLEKKGFLSDSSTINDQLKRLTEEKLKEITDYSEKVVELQRKQIDELNIRIQQTAAGISVVQAQEQFDIAKKHLWRRTLGWGIVSGLSFSGFVIFAIYLLHHAPASLLRNQLETTANALNNGGNETSNVPLSLVVAQTAYLTAIRITLLTAIGALTTFCLRMMRSAMHMAEYNDHRRRVANCMTSFVAAAGTPEQRDSILAMLVSAVAQFGDSGLLDGTKDPISMPSIAIESITRNLSQTRP